MVTVTLKCGDSQHQIDVDPADGVEVRTPLLHCVLSQLGFQALLPRKWTDSLSHSEPKQPRVTACDRHTCRSSSTSGSRCASPYLGRARSSDSWLFYQGKIRPCPLNLDF